MRTTPMVWTTTIVLVLVGFGWYAWSGTPPMAAPEAPASALVLPPEATQGDLLDYKPTTEKPATTTSAPKPPVATSTGSTTQAR